MEAKRKGSYVKGPVLAETSFEVIYKALPVEREPSVLLYHEPAGAISGNKQALDLVASQIEKWSKVKDLHCLNVLDSGYEGDDFFFVTESRQGRILSQVLERAQLEQMGLSPDQAIYIVERAAQTIASLATHGIKCGGVSPERILLTFEGEALLLPCAFKDLQTIEWTGENPLAPMLKYLPADASEGKTSGSQSDVYALGALLFRLLTGEDLVPEEGELDIPARIEEAAGGIGFYSPLSESLVNILKASLIADTPESYAKVDGIKEALGQLITSGEYGPTTFNMAFLMHSLFREEEGQEAKDDEALIDFDRSTFLAELEAERKPAEPVEPEPAEKPTPKPSALEESLSHTEPDYTPPSFMDGEAEEPADKKKIIIFAGAAVVLLAVIIGTWLIFFRKTGPSQEQLAKQALEQKLAEERAKSAAQRAEMAKRLQAIEDEKKALEDQINKATTEREKRQARQALAAAQNRLDAEKKKLSEQAPPTEVATSEDTAAKTAAAENPGEAKDNPGTGEAKTAKSSGDKNPTETSAETPAGNKTETATTPAKTQPAEQPAKKVIKAGDFVESWALDVKPNRLNKPRIRFTKLARQNNVKGIVYITVDVNETGKVTEAKVIRGPSPDFGMKEVCRMAAMNLKYSPGIKDGVPVKTKVTFPIKLE